MALHNDSGGILDRLATVYGDSAGMEPSQFFAAKTASGEIRLCIALVEDAMWQIRLHVQHGEWGRAAEELRWFEGAAADGVTFERICECLKLEERRVLAVVHRMFGTSAQAAERELKRRIEKMRQANFRRNTTRAARRAEREPQLKFA